MFSPENEKFMGIALEYARKAALLGEVPVGAVIVRNGEIISTGFNRRETEKNALLHAEVCAIDGACRKLGTRRLSDCDIYVTLEPCPMCAGAIINACIPRVWFGAFDVKNGAFGGVCDLSNVFTFRPELHWGLLEEECASVLSEFFGKLR